MAVMLCLGVNVPLTQTVRYLLIAMFLVEWHSMCVSLRLSDVISTVGSTDEVINVNAQSLVPPCLVQSAFR